MGPLWEKNLVPSRPKTRKKWKAIEFYRVFLLSLDEKSRAVRPNGAQDALSGQKVQDFLPLAVVFSALRPDSAGLFAHKPNSTALFVLRPEVTYYSS